MVILAEMGDKTQLLAMAFATRFKTRDVLLGVFIATVLNHALAVALGTYMGSSLNFQMVQIVAGISFILFGLWTIHGDRLQGEENRKLVWGPVVTVTIGFFIAEMGDKTQLATVALAAKYDAPALILLGTTTGMLIADAVGIFIGVLAGRRLPEKLVKWISAGIFIAFGFISLYMSVPERFISFPYVAGLVVITAGAILLIKMRDR